MTLPKIAVLALGGTIASAPPRPGAAATMDLDAGYVVASVPKLGEIADLQAETFRNLGSAELSMSDIVALARKISELSSEGVEGVVVTQGTDTLEETSFLLDLLDGIDIPVIVTGAMRNAGLPGSDGPANLLAAVRVAADPAARDAGVLVVMNDEIHLPRFVRKGHATSTAAFQSPLTGPVGWIAEDRVRLPLVLRRRSRRFGLPVTAQMSQVALLTLSLDDSPRLIECVDTADFGGAVISTFGAGHTSSRVLDALKALSIRMPTVFASRIGAGELHSHSCDFGGSELRLLERGLISSVTLDAFKARLFLRLLLASGAGRAEIEDGFREYSL